MCLSLTTMVLRQQCGPGSTPGLGIMWVEFVVGYPVFALKGFFPGTPVFPSPQKPTFPNSS